MADSIGPPDPGDGIGVGSEPGSPPGMPRWLKVSGIIVGALLVAFVILQLIGVGGGHGPGRHGPGAQVPGDGHEGATMALEHAAELAAAIIGSVDRA